MTRAGTEALRILKVSRCYYPATEYGGPIGKMLAIIRGLTRSGHAVTVYTSNLLNPRDKMSEATSLRDVEGARVVYLNSVVNYHWDGITPDIFGLCRKELRDFDVIHIYGYRDFISTIVSWHAARWSIPYVIEPMGMFKPIVRSVTEKRLYDWIYGGRMTDRAAGVIATSQAEREDIVANGADPCKVVIRRNGIDLGEFTPPSHPGGFRRRLGLKDSDRLLLYLGRISKKKGIDLLIQALCDSRLTETHLAVVGPDDCDGHLENLKKMVDTSSLKTSVFFTGPLYGREKVEALSDSDVVVLPSANENFGNVVAEALACGTPVVLTDRCGIAPFVLGRAPEVRSDSAAAADALEGSVSPTPATAPDAGAPYDVGRVGLVVPFRADALREALVRILSDGALLAELRNNTRTAAAELSWDGPIRQMEEIYRSLALGRRLSALRDAAAVPTANPRDSNHQRRET
jgi:glycosyltransferase involved in cell wall biosynthesis